VETKRHCLKRLGERVTACTFERQVVELHVRVAVLNRFSQLGRPQTVSVAAVAGFRQGLRSWRPIAGLCSRAGPRRSAQYCRSPHRLWSVSPRCAVSGRTDVVMKLFGPDKPTRLVAKDDDSGQSINARIAHRLSSGRYWVQIRHHHLGGGTGDCSIKVRMTWS
jgi:hypothetical protein